MSRRYQGGFISGTYVPFLTPNAPTNVTAVGGNTQVTVSFTAPANVGGGAITSYTVVSSGGQYATGTSSPITVTGLTNGTSYTFTVYATNTYGPGQRSAASNSVTPNVAITATLYAWGGGGAGGYAAGSGAGGGGGAATGTINLASFTSGVIVIGGGGASIAPEAGTGPAVAGGGGLVGTSGYGGQGGGYTGLFVTSATQANSVLIAGGGGGGAYEGANGGAGGGTAGANGGSGAVAGGTGGTQSAAGTGQSGTTAAGALQGGGCGGSGDGGGGGGGGGGYWGGGAGTGNNPGSAGGGGSGYINTTYVSSGVLTAGSGATPGDSGNALRGSYGNGGASGLNNGVQGVFILRYADTAPALSSTTGSPSVSVSGGFRTYTWTSAGSFTV